VAFVLENVVPAWMVGDEPYNTFLEADRASSLELKSGDTADPS
jgi:hypothetical protein